MIVKQGDGKYVVYSHSTGKKLATYDTRAKAEADVQRRHIFKHKGGK